MSRKMLNASRRDFLKGLACAALAPGHLPAPAPLAATTRGAAFEFVSVLEHEALIGAHDIEIRGTLVFVAGKANKPLGRKAGRFAILDIADPAKPSVTGMLTEEDDVGLHNAQTVLLMGDICLLGSDDLLAIDIAEPRAPKIVTRVRHQKIARINGMIQCGSAVVAANKSGCLDVFDVSDPREPEFVGALDTRALGDLQSPHDIARFGPDHVVVPSAGKNVPVHFGIYEVSKEGATLLPIENWHLAGTISSETLAGANRIVTDARYAYVACHYSNRIGVIDLAKPRSPELVATLPTVGAEPDGLTLDNGVLFVGAGKTVEAIDVSTPERPVSLAHFEGEPIFSTPKNGRAGNAHDLVVRDGLVHVTAQADGRIGILRFRHM